MEHDQEPSSPFPFFLRPLFPSGGGGSRDFLALIWSGNSSIWAHNLETGQGAAKFLGVEAIEEIGEGIMVGDAMLKGHETAKKSFHFAAKLTHVGTGLTAREYGQ